MLYDAFGEYQEAYLSNGLRILSAHYDYLPYQKIDFILRSGANKDGNKPGTRHMVEHYRSLAIQGKSFTAIERYLERHGSDTCFGEVDYVSTRFGCKVPPAIVREASDIFGAILFDPAFPKKSNLEDDSIVREFSKHFGHIERYDLLRQSRQALFGSHPLARYIDELGNPDEIREITYDDLEAHYDRYFRPQAVTILTMGSLSQDDLLRTLEKTTCNRLKLFSSTEAEVCPVATPALPQIARVELEPTALEYISSEQGYFKTSILLPGQIHYHLVEILERMLEKLLYIELRDRRGWVYDPQVNTKYLSAAWVIDIECELSKESWPEAEEVIEEVLSGLSEAKQLFADTRLYFINRLNIMDSAEVHAEASEMLVYLGKLESRERQQKTLRSLKFRHVLDLADNFDSKRRYTVLRPPMKGTARKI